MKVAKEKKTLITLFYYKLHLGKRLSACQVFKHVKMPIYDIDVNCDLTNLITVNINDMILL